MGYTSAEVITIIVAVGGLVTVVGGVIVQIMSARMKQAVKEVAQVLVPVATETLATAQVIKGHVNSEKSIAEGEIKTKDVEIRILREQLNEMRQDKALLAAKVPVSIQMTNGPLTRALEVPRASSEGSLERIDTNTKETARNTERTEAVVQDLKNQS